MNLRQLEIIYGTLLGDGYIAKMKHGNKFYCRFEVEHSAKDSGYIQWLYNELKDILSAKPRIRERYSNLGGRGIKSTSYSLYSKISETFSRLRDETYVDETKRVTNEWLEKLTPLSLAVWYMDDGSYHINRNTIEISTYSFTLAEHHLMQRYLANKYNINVSITTHGKGQNKKFKLYFPRDEARKLLEIIHTHIIPCMQRKLPLGWENAFQLPPNFHIKASDNKSLILSNIVSFYEGIGSPDKFPIVSYNYTPCTYSYKAITRVFGSWEKALSEAGVPTEFM